MLSCKKKKSGVCVHPVLAVTLLGFAAVGMLGVACAVKKKAGAMKKAAKKLGCACVDSACEKTEDALAEGIAAAEKLTGKS